MILTVRVSGDLRAILKEETQLAAAAVRRGVESAGRAVQDELRGQVRAAGFKGGGRGLANAWRLAVYPRPGVVTLHPAASIRTQAPAIIDAFESGAPITVKRTKYLCWPTGYNAASGRRAAGSRGGVRVTPQEMARSKGQSVVIPSRTPGLSLWCLRARQVGGSRSRVGGRFTNRARLYVGNRNVEVATGKLKKGERNALIQELATRGLVAMFFLARSVTPGKRLDVAGVAQRAPAVLEREVRAALGRP